MGYLTRAATTATAVDESHAMEVKPSSTGVISRYTLSLAAMDDFRVSPLSEARTPARRYRVTGLPAQFGEIRIAEREGRWQIHRDIAKGWSGSYASAADALDAVRREFD